MRAFVIAMPSEAEAVRPLLRPTDCLYVSGIGKVNAALTTQKALDEGATEVWNAGVAGGFDPLMRVGDVCAISRAVEYDFDLAAVNGSRIGQLDERDSPFFDLAPILTRGSWLGMPRILATGDRFNDSFDDLPVLRDLGATVRDMEGAAIAHVCERNAVPCRIVKAISDVHGSGSMTDQYRRNAALALARLSETFGRILREQAEI